jgi:hypothetical protein
MLEVYYKPPLSEDRNSKVAAEVQRYRGSITCVEAPELDGATSVCLTVEFGSWDSAEAAALALRAHGEHVEGPCNY